MSAPSAPEFSPNSPKEMGQQPPYAPPANYPTPQFPPQNYSIHQNPPFQFQSQAYSPQQFPHNCPPPQQFPQQNYPAPQFPPPHYLQPDMEQQGTGQYYTAPPSYGNDVPQGGQYGQAPYMSAMPGAATGGDELEVEVQPKDFYTDRASRVGFARKVFAILALQMVFPIGTICALLYMEDIKDTIQEHNGFYIIGWTGLVLSWATYICCTQFRKQFPWNIISLVLYTIVLSYGLGVISSYHGTDGILRALGICMGAFIGLSLLTFCTKFEITGSGTMCGSGISAAFLLVLCMVGIVSSFTINSIFVTLYAGLGAAVFVLMFRCDLQKNMIFGVRDKLTPDDYIFAVTQLYMNVLSTFLFFCAVLCKNNKTTNRGYVIKQK